MSDLAKEEIWIVFRDAAIRYCTALDQALEQADKDFLYAAVSLPLAELYVAGLLLPWVGVTEDEIEVETLGSDEQ